MTVHPAAAPRLILASTSRYRRELLARLRLPFEVESPRVDETALAGETGAALAARLARAKALAVAQAHPGALVIGSDQVAECDGVLLGKPGSVANACAQLRRCAGRSVQFHTAVCLVDARDASLQATSALDLTEVAFRPLDDGQIARYVEAEQPLDCAGSFKCEGLGISLFRHIRSNDPTALVGLPLIALCELLRAASVALP